MSPFSKLRSPRRKWSDPSNGEDDVKGVSNVGASRNDDTRNGSEPKDGDDKETKGHRGFNKEFLHSIRNRIRGNSSSSKQAPTLAPSSPSSQRPALQGPASLVPNHSRRPTISDTKSPTSTTPLSPKGPINPNKPLPSPPPPGSEKDRPRPVLKLNRIMATLTEAEIEKLFSGAPQYFARSIGHFSGAPLPMVAFPYDEAVEIRDLTDHTQIADRAWGCVTAWPHITRDVKSDRSAAQRATEDEVKRRAHFYPRCQERPNMLSMFGLEKGSIGYQAALELSVSDALQEELWGFPSLTARRPAVLEQRKRLLTSKDGLRDVQEHFIMEQLIKNSRRYTEQHLRLHRLTNELYNELFLHILHPPTKVLDHNDPYSLAVQILALVKVLATPNMWIDFSHVEWRIRLGQLLWDNPVEDEAGDGASTKAGESAANLQEERYWLLLQILLACELLIRLDAITDGAELDSGCIPRAEVYKFEKEANTSVRWSLILARTWLENMEVVRMEPTVPETGDEEKRTGWLATLTKRMSLSHHHHHDSSPHRSPVYAIRGKHAERQADGLAHFARLLRWPEAESYVSKISENCRSVVEGTPIHTPLVAPSSRRRPSSDHGEGERSSSGGRPNHKRHRRTIFSTELKPAGWLTKSYVSGLMLPGEGLCYLLMAALLENNPEALSRLGSTANLSGGFVYSGKSFWSTACIVGRVLAAGKGAVECMGWISSDVIPQGFGDGWLDVEAEETKDDSQNVDKRARIWGKKAIEREADVLGDADPASVFPADFIIPFENIYRDEMPPILDIKLRNLKLQGPDGSRQTEGSTEDSATVTSDVTATNPQQAQKYAATITFSVTDVDSEETTDYTFSLVKDINFVTAHPCVPSHHVRIMKSPTSPTIQHIDASGISSAGGRTASIVGHPLHKYFTYTVLHLSELLAKRDSSLETFLESYSSATHRPSLAPTTSASATTMAKVLVIDCITNFQPLPQEHEIPLSPVLSRTDSNTSAMTLSPLSPTSPGPWGSGSGGGFDNGGLAGALESASKKMHSETRRRQFGSDMEILARAICAEKGWNALISRRRRGCLACAIREASALGWKVIIRVD